MYLVGGFNPSEKNMKVSWDLYSQYMESPKINVPNHQPDSIYYNLTLLQRCYGKSSFLDFFRAKYRSILHKGMILHTVDGPAKSCTTKRMVETEKK